MDSAKITGYTDAYSCSNCGAPLKYQPNTLALVCPYCNTVNEIEQVETKIEELDFDKYMQDYTEENVATVKVVECSNCKATPTVDENLKSMHCPYCSSPLIETDVHEERFIRPQYVLPFSIDEGQIAGLFATWVKGLYFAPNKLKRAMLSSLNLTGIYIPYWTYDAQTETRYTGRRGDNYTTTVGSGKNRRTVTRIRWRSAAGRVAYFFDDVLVPATKSLKPDLLGEVSNWDTPNLIAINDSYLAGFVTEKYQVDLKAGYERAKIKMDETIRYEVRRDIGGDHQEISSMSTDFSDITFKHVLLPIYVSAFRYRDKIFTFYVNGRTGKVVGERPWSKIKIIFASLAALIVAAGIVYLIKTYAE